MRNFTMAIGVAGSWWDHGRTMAAEGQVHNRSEEMSTLNGQCVGGLWCRASRWCTLGGADNKYYASISCLPLFVESRNELSFI